MRELVAASTVAAGGFGAHSIVFCVWTRWLENESIAVLLK
jgi:hypothetical protein